MAPTTAPTWVLDLTTPPTKSKNSSIPDPPGYTAPTSVSSKSTKGGKLTTTTPSSPRKPPTDAEMDTLKLKKAWEIAIAPAKQLPMSAIGMYMSGNSLQIFSIMMVFMLFKTPVQAVLGMNQTFARFETDGIRSQLLGVKAVFVVMNMLSLALGIWKVNGMGLLPTTRSDWLAWEVAREPLERAFPAW